jgi:hypothetical protein
MLQIDDILAPTGVVVPGVPIGFCRSCRGSGVKPVRAAGRNAAVKKLELFVVLETQLSAEGGFFNDH